MPIRVYLNRVKGSSAMSGAAGSRFVEMAFVDDIPATNPAGIKALAINAPTIPKVGEGHPANPNARVTSVVADPADGQLTGTGGQCWVTITYETNQGSAGGNRWTIRDGSVLVPTQTTCLPGTLLPLRTSWKNPLDANQLDEDAPTIAYSKPHRTLTATGEIGGRPSKAWFDAIGCVNQSLWQGLKPGYWLCTGVETETKNQGSSYAVEVGFISRINMDWSEYGFVRDFGSGKFRRVKDAEATALFSKTYFWGDIGGNGISKIGPYEMKNFSAVFRTIPFN